MTIGIDLVAMCVNDLIVQGAKPLFFRLHSYWKLKLSKTKKILKGIFQGCEISGCKLIGGKQLKCQEFTRNINLT